MHIFLCHEIYDGSFSGKRIPGQGVFARALPDAGYPVLDAEDIEGIVPGRILENIRKYWTFLLVYGTI